MAVKSKKRHPYDTANFFLTVLDFLKGLDIETKCGLQIYYKNEATPKAF